MSDEKKLPDKMTPEDYAALLKANADEGIAEARLEAARAAVESAELRVVLAHRQHAPTRARLDDAYGKGFRVKAETLEIERG